MIEAPTLDETDFVFVETALPNKPWDELVKQVIAVLDSMSIFKEGGNYLFDSHTMSFKSEQAGWFQLKGRNIKETAHQSTAGGIKAVVEAVANTLDLAQKFQQQIDTPTLSRSLEIIHQKLLKAQQALFRLKRSRSHYQMILDLDKQAADLPRVIVTCEKLWQSFSGTSSKQLFEHAIPIQKFPVPFPRPDFRTQQFAFNQTFASELFDILNYVAKNAFTSKNKDYHIYKGKDLYFKFSILVTRSGNIYVLYHIPLGIAAQLGCYKKVKLCFFEKQKNHIVKLSQREKSRVIEREHKCLKLIKEKKHPNFPEVYDLFLNEKGKLLAFVENCAGGDLGRSLHLFWGKIDKIRKIGIEILKGLSFLHANELTHLDVKPENVLLTAQLEGKLSDFGISAKVGTVGKEPGTGYYRSYELLDDCYHELVTAFDIMSWGLVIYQLLNSCLIEDVPWIKGANSIAQLNDAYRSMKHRDRFPEPSKNAPLHHACWLSFLPSDRRPTATTLLTKLGP